MFSSITFSDFGVWAFVSRDRGQAVIIDTPSNQVIGFLFRPYPGQRIILPLFCGLVFRPNPYYLGQLPHIADPVWEVVDTMMVKSPTNGGFAPDNRYDP